MSISLQRAVFPLLLCTATAAFLAGCGGGGSNGNSGGIPTTSGSNSGISTGGSNSGGNTGVPPTSPDSSITGRIVDVNGDGIPGANVIADSGGTTTTSLSQGGYRLDITSGTVHRIIASATHNGTVYSGSTQVLSFADRLASNVNIILSDPTRQASVSGIVSDSAGRPIVGARVYLALSRTVAAKNSSSLVAYTDANGAYTLTSIPVDVSSGVSFALSASARGYQNVTQTLSNVGAGGAYNQALTLPPATNAAIQPPALTAAYVSTEPTSVLTGNARAARAVATGASSPYEALRRRLSPGYARLANQRGPNGTRRTARAAGNYAVETDLAFTEDSLTSSSVYAYTVYRTAGAILPALGTTPFYDQVLDPLANYYTDLTFSNSSAPTLSGARYNFGLTAVSTGTTGSVESALSSVVSVTPLGPLTLLTPTAGQIGVNPVSVAWSPVDGVTGYRAFLYTEFPTINASPQDLGLIPATTTELRPARADAGPDVLYRGCGRLRPGRNRWLARLQLLAAALTFSPITAFTVSQ